VPIATSFSTVSRMMTPDAAVVSLSIRQHASAYVSIRQHTSAYVTKAFLPSLLTFSVPYPLLVLFKKRTKKNSFQKLLKTQQMEWSRGCCSRATRRCQAKNLLDS
jgi:hypothetical protein